MDIRQLIMPNVFIQVIFSLKMKNPVTKLAKTLKMFKIANTVESGIFKTSYECIK